MLVSPSFLLNKKVSLHLQGKLIVASETRRIFCSNKTSTSWVQAYRENLISPAISEINLGGISLENQNTGGTSFNTAYNNYFGRINYYYKSNYLLEFSFRSDGSQIFLEGGDCGFFPGFSAGWVMSEDSFIKDDLSFIDFLKVRVTAGSLGWSQVGQFQYLQSFSINSSNAVFGVNDASGVTAGTLANLAITLEKSTKTELQRCYCKVIIMKLIYYQHCPRHGLMGSLKDYVHVAVLELAWSGWMVNYLSRLSMLLKVVSLVCQYKEYLKGGLNLKKEQQKLLQEYSGFRI